VFCWTLEESESRCVTGTGTRLGIDEGSDTAFEDWLGSVLRATGEVQEGRTELKESSTAFKYSGRHKLIMSS